MVKTRLYSEDYQEKVKVLYMLNYEFSILMKLLHPFMPFVTTEIYRNLVKYDDKDLIISEWPKSNNQDFSKDFEFVERLKRIITEIRNTRANMNVHPSKKANLIFVTKEYDNQLNEAKEFLLKLGFGNKIIIQNDKTGIKDNAISIVEDGIELYMPFEGLVDIEQEIKRLEEEIYK